MQEEVKRGEKENEKEKESFDLKKMEKEGLVERVLEGKAGTQREVREKVVKFIRSYNQLRDLEDKNLENNTSVRYSTRDEIFIGLVKRLRKDDMGGYIYHDDVKGYDLEELIQIGAELEDKPMEVEDWVHLYKHLV